MSETPIPQWARKLAAIFLRDYASRLDNDGCNDYTPPAWVPKDELIAALRAWDCPEDDDLEHWESMCQTNWAVVDAIAELLHPFDTPATHAPPASVQGEVREALRAAEGALSTCYDVAYFPANGESGQDLALTQVRQALSTLENK